MKKGTNSSVSLFEIVVNPCDTLKSFAVLVSKSGAALQQISKSIEQWMRYQMTMTYDENKIPGKQWASLGHECSKICKKTFIALRKDCAWTKSTFLISIMFNASPSEEDKFTFGLKNLCRPDYLTSAPMGQFSVVHNLNVTYSLLQQMTNYGYTRMDWWKIWNEHLWMCAYEASFCMWLNAKIQKFIQKQNK